MRNLPRMFAVFLLLVISSQTAFAQSVQRDRLMLTNITRPALASSPVHMCLNKKHAALVPELARARAAMKSDDSYRRIFGAILKPFELRQETR